MMKSSMDLPPRSLWTIHEEIAKLLGSQEVLSLFGTPAVEGENEQQEKDLFLKRVVEAVSPIDPLTSRN